MKKYHIFAGDTYYAQPAWSNYLLSVENEDDALRMAQDVLQQPNHWYVEPHEFSGVEPHEFSGWDFDTRTPLSYKDEIVERTETNPNWSDRHQFKADWWIVLETLDDGSLGIVNAGDKDRDGVPQMMYELDQ